MPTPVRVGARRGSGAQIQSPQTFENTMSGYGSTVGSSVGYSPRNPYAYMATQGAKAYPKKATSDG